MCQGSKKGHGGLLIQGQGLTETGGQQLWPIQALLLFKPGEIHLVGPVYSSGLRNPEVWWCGDCGSSTWPWWSVALSSWRAREGGSDDRSWLSLQKAWWPGHLQSGDTGQPCPPCLSGKRACQGCWEGSLKVTRLPGHLCMEISPRDPVPTSQSPRSASRWAETPGFMNFCEIFGGCFNLNGPRSPLTHSVGGSTRGLPEEPASLSRSSLLRSMEGSVCGCGGGQGRELGYPGR